MSDERTLLSDVSNWLVAAVGVMTVGVYTDLRMRIKSRLLRSAFIEYKDSRAQRDLEVDRRLDEIKNATSRTEDRINDIYTHLVGKK